MNKEWIWYKQSWLFRLFNVHYRIIIDDQINDLCSIQRKLMFWKTLIVNLSMEEAKIFLKQLESGIPFYKVNAERKFIHYVDFVRKQSKITEERLEAQSQQMSIKYLDKITNLTKDLNLAKKEITTLKTQNEKDKKEKEIMVKQIELLKEKVTDFISDNSILSIKL